VKPRECRVEGEIGPKLFDQMYVGGPQAGFIPPLMPFRLSARNILRP
jgi:hypothetical protein